ncbi:hypothetical protein V6N13_070338 [Hibiscus sabdariffa]
MKFFLCKESSKLGKLRLLILTIREFSHDSHRSRIWCFEFLEVFYTCARHADHHRYLLHFMDPRSFTDEKSESRLYVGNLDLRITEAALIKMFSPYGKIISEDFLWHTRGPKRGEPRGFAFIQYSTKEEAKLAKEKMHGRLACGRPLMVHLASEKYSEEAPKNSSKARGEAIKSGAASSVSGQMSRSAKITAIKNKLKALDEGRDGAKKQKAS